MSSHSLTVFSDSQERNLCIGRTEDGDALKNGLSSSSPSFTIFQKKINNIFNNNLKIFTYNIPLAQSIKIELTALKIPIEISSIVFEYSIDYIFEKIHTVANGKEFMKDSFNVTSYILNSKSVVVNEYEIITKEIIEIINKKEFLIDPIKYLNDYFERSVKKNGKSCSHSEFHKLQILLYANKIVGGFLVFFDQNQAQQEEKLKTIEMFNPSHLSNEGVAKIRLLQLPLNGWYNTGDELLNSSNSLFENLEIMKNKLREWEGGL